MTVPKAAEVEALERAEAWLDELASTGTLELFDDDYLALEVVVAALRSAAYPGKGE